MALPAGYSELTLAQYMHGSLGATAALLGWDEPDESVTAPYDEAVNDALLLYGVSDIDQATEIKKIRIAARLAIWQRVLDWSYSLNDFSTDGDSFKFSGIKDAAMKRVKALEQEAAGVGITTGAAPTLRIYDMVYPDDPYIVLSDEERMTR